MIVSLKGKLTEEVLWGERCPKGFPPDIFQRAKRKLQSIAAARDLIDLRVPPGN